MKKANTKLQLSKQQIQYLGLTDMSNQIGGALPPVYIPQTLSRCMSIGGEDGRVTCRSMM